MKFSGQRAFASFHAVAAALAFTIASTAGASSASTFAEKELLVRFKQSQSSDREAMMSTMRALGRSNRASAKVLSREEGVVKLKFASAEEAQAAEEKLRESGAVANVSKNHLYRPALQMSPRSVQKRLATEGVAFPYHGPSASNPVPARAPRRPPLAPITIPAPLEPVDPVVDGTDPWETKDWAMTAINMPAHDQVPPALEEITTAVIDTGVDYNHEDLIDVMWRSPSDPKEVGFDFAHGNAMPYDVVHFDIQGCLNDAACGFAGIGAENFMVNPGHGTHCAGHVAALANNSLGIRGAGTGTKIMAMKFFYDVGEPYAGSGDDAAAIQTIDYAIANGAKVISASWGGYSDRAEAEGSELKEAMIRAQQAGILFIVAAGNGRPNMNTGEQEQVDQDNDPQPSYPAAYELDNVITVAASDKADALAGFSNYGARTVHIAAPGVKILSTVAPGLRPNSGASQERYDDAVARITQPDGSTMVLDWDGTSMATPIVAGAAALVWSRYPKLTYLEVKEALLTSVRASAALQGKVSSGGVLDVQAALQAADRLAHGATP